MSDGPYDLRELRELVDHETSERRALEGEVIGLGVKMEACTHEVRALGARMDRHVEATHKRLDRLMEHLGVPFEGKS